MSNPAPVTPGPLILLGRWLHWLVAAGLLALPAIAMRFTDEVNWQANDFVIMGGLLFVSCAAWEAFRRHPGRRVRVAAALTVLTAFLSVWANLAVGLIGDPGHPLNLWFHAIAAGLVPGSLWARLRPGRMAIVTASAATLHALGLVIGAAQGAWVPWPAAVMVGLWMLASALFARAAHVPRQA